MRTPVILVGVDGSAASGAALRWALKESARRGARVEAMLAYHQEPVLAPASSMSLHPYGERPQRHPAREQHAAVLQARATVPDAPDVAETVVVAMRRTISRSPPRTPSSSWSARGAGVRWRKRCWAAWARSACATRSARS